MGQDQSASDEPSEPTDLVLPPSSKATTILGIFEDTIEQPKITFKVTLPNQQQVVISMERYQERGDYTLLCYAQNQGAQALQISAHYD